MIIDNVGNHSLQKNRGVLNPEGKLVIVGGPGGNWIGPMLGPIGAMLLSPFVDQEFSVMMARANSGDLGHELLYLFMIK